MKSNGADLESPLSFPTHPSPSEAEVIPRKPYLDLDILFLLLFTFLKRRNHRLALLRTCKSLYHFGAHILLQDPITIRTPGGLLSLTSFIQSNPVARIPHLRRIRIDLRGLESEWEQDESWVEALFPWFELLPTLVHLEDISWEPSGASAILQPRLPEIISSFPKLTSLRLLSAGSEVREMLEPLTHSLTKLHLSFVTGTAPTMILSVLEQLGPRLEELHLGSEVALRQLRTTHTNIKSLTLENWRTVDKRSLVNFFPNLRRLSYISEQPRRRLSPADVILHNSNLRVETPASWCSEHLCGDLTTIQLFHPSGHVDHLHATDIKRDNLSHLAGILVNTTPTRLSLELHASLLRLYINELYELFRVPHMQQILKLDITIIFYAAAGAGSSIPVSPALLEHESRTDVWRQGLFVRDAQQSKYHPFIPFFATNRRRIPITMGSNT